MPISVYYDKDEVRHITVSGKIETSEEMTEVLRLMDDYGKGKSHIIFPNAYTIHYSIVEKIYQLQKAKTLKIFVLKSSLYSYLSRLGVNSCYVLKNTNNSILVPEDKDSQSQCCSKHHLTEFLQEISRIYGYDYTQYQTGSVERRIKISMLREGINDFKDFGERVLKDQELFEQLFLDLSVNTTEFFRNPEVYEKLRKDVLPHLNTLSYIKIWSAGCSTGEEPYSLAILLEEAGMLDKCQIYATDINPHVIEEARNGLYSLKDIEKNIINYRNSKGKKSFTSYFDIREDYIKIEERIKNNILFFQYNLDKTSILSEFNLILCRNVLIYFKTGLQTKIIEKFYNSLDSNGFLVLGKSEDIAYNGGKEYFYPYDRETKIFRVRKEPIYFGD